MRFSDVNFIFEIENNPENWAISGTASAFTKQEIIDFVNTPQNITENKQFRFIICNKTTHKAIGTIDLFEYDTKLNTVGIGILIAHKENRNKGYATEALNLIISYCKTKLNITKLFCNIFKDNNNSIRLFKKCGFSFVEEKMLFNNLVNYYELTLLHD